MKLKILEDLITAAINDAKQKGETVTQEEMKSLTGGLPLPPWYEITILIYGAISKLIN